MNPSIRICFVCLGNICRSPTAEAVFLDLIKRERVDQHFIVDSAGTSSFHVGERAHSESRAEAKRRGIEVPSISRQFVRKDFGRFDLVVAMDGSNEATLRRMAPDAEARAKVVLFRDFDAATAPGTSVPDPYYEGGFDRVYDICDAAARGLLASLRSERGF